MSDLEIIDSLRRRIRKLEGAYAEANQAHKLAEGRVREIQSLCEWMTKRDAQARALLRQALDDGFTMRDEVEAALRLLET